MSEANGALGAHSQANPTHAPQPDINNSDNVAAVVIGLYLVVQIVVLCRLALTVWLTSDCSSWGPVLFGPLHLPCPEKLPAEKLAAFQRLVISGCMAGLGGAVYMVRGFFQKYAYGFQPPPDKDGNKPPKEFLHSKEIPRYVLLPFSSVILGPITMALARGGAITFTGLTGGKELPMFTVVGLSFVLGFTYHDTLNGLARLSETFFSKRKKDEQGKDKEETNKGKESNQSAAQAAGK